LVYSRSDFERFKSKQQKVNIKMIGMLSLASDIPADLAREVVETVKILGIFVASDEVKTALADRMK
jgi:hypothetical protein